MNDISDRYRSVRNAIAAAEAEAGRPKGEVTLVAVGKTFDADEIRPVLEEGHRVFGENRVQEAMAKWPRLKEEFGDVELHLIGPLQSNKAKDAVALFDVIETVDREKIAVALKTEMARAGKHPRLLVQVNIGLEPQKAGIAPAEAVAFVERCREVHGLAIDGMMAIPPEGVPPGPYFAHMAELAQQVGATVLSMGMSADFETAIAMGATHVRVGSALFGQRPKP